jgi:hypothetical protein
MQTVNENVVTILQSAGIKFNITPKGAGLKRDGWECDGWMLELSHKNNTEYFDYFTGIGHRVVPKLDKHLIMREYKGSRMLAAKLAEKAKPVTPEVCGILYSLILDGEALHTSFSDWCDNFDYDSDSIKALNTYQACTDNAKKMRRVIDNPTLELLREALQDY